MTKPISKYTFGESKNLQVYENYSSITITLNDTDASGSGDGSITGVITGVARSGATATYTTSTDPHGLAAGDVIVVSGTTNFNTSDLATQIVQSTATDTTFTMTLSAETASDESGLSATYISSANIEEGTDWTTSGDGVAKKITIIPISGTSGDEIKLYLKINGSYGDAMTTLFDDFPITIDNLLVDQIKLSSGDETDGDEVFEVLSFH
jgi:Tfp pilus assembly protein PilW